MITTYGKYKHSDIEWLQLIPEHWKSINIKYLANGGNSLFNDGNWIESDIITESGIRYITSGNIGPGFYKEQGNGYVSEATFLSNNFTEVFPGDLLISRLNDPIGRACIIPELENRIVTCVDNVILRPKEPFNRQYLMYLMNSKEYSSVTSLIARGATMKRISRSLLGQIKIPAPTGNEQVQIARYLNHKTSIIDEVIGKKEKLIENLKEKRLAIINEAVTKGLDPNAKTKDSGIDSFGKIPEDWTVTKLKYLSNVKGRIGFRGYTTDDLVSEDQGALALGASHISWDGDIDLTSPVFISWEKYHESPEIQLKKEDIVVVQRGSTCGKVAIISKEIGPATINPSLVVLKNVRANPFYVFASIKAALSELVNLTRSSAIPMLSQEQIGNLQIVLPPKEIQGAIVEYLDRVKSRFSDVIAKHEKSILNLKEYRQSLISEAVTGKIDVRDWEPPAKN